jgi:dTDP-4-dehydrorhamnose reductase
LSKVASLVVGATGQIGHQMMGLLGDGALPTTRSVMAPAGWLRLDLAELNTLATVDLLLRGRELSAIYCLAGFTNVDGCEGAQELAYATNCRGPAMLASAARVRGIPFVYFSTEYVFDGHDGPYQENSPANPLSIYGRSKWQGELAVFQAYSDALVLRTTVVYGPDSGEKNFVYSLMRNLSAGKKMRVPEDQVSTPTYNRDLAATTLALVDRQAAGIFHVCGPERMGRLEFARSVALRLGLDSTLLDGCPTSALGQRAPRPLTAGLSIDKLLRAWPDLRMRGLNEALADCKGELQEFLFRERHTNLEQNRDTPGTAPMETK